ncbi:MAG: hypothetical protein ACW99G_14720 [Candidatus Thorarchaeota archaeon]|jgi:hypothetical protein
MDEDRGMEDLLLESHVVQGLAPIEIIKFIDKKKKRFLAIGLNDLEQICETFGISKDSDEFQLVRKLILDLVNEYTRSLMVIIFGDIEHSRYRAEQKPKDKEKNG